MEPKTGVFLGNPSKRVRDELWALAVSKAKTGTVTQIWSDRCPQGYSFRTCGKPDRELVDVEGVALVRTKIKPETAKGRKCSRAVVREGSQLAFTDDSAEEEP